MSGTWDTRMMPCLCSITAGAWDPLEAYSFPCLAPELDKRSFGWEHFSLTWATPSLARAPMGMCPERPPRELAAKREQSGSRLAAEVTPRRSGAALCVPDSALTPGKGNPMLLLDEGETRSHLWRAGGNGGTFESTCGRYPLPL